MTDSMTLKDFHSMPKQVRDFAYNMILKSFINEQMDAVRRPAFFRDVVYDKKGRKSRGAMTLGIK